MSLRGAVVACAVLAAPVIAGCDSGDAGLAAVGTSAAPVTAATSAAPVTGSSTGLPDSSARADGWPAEAPPEPGGRVWAVYLAVGPTGDPELAAATAYLAERGYSAREQELGCDVEAADALRRDRQERAVAVYFAGRVEAADFLTRLKPVGSHEEGRGFVEMLPVTRGCFD